MDGLLDVFAGLGVKAFVAMFAFVIGPAITAGIRKYVAMVPPKYAPVVSLVSGAIIAAFDPATGAQAAVDGVIAQKMVDRVPVHARPVERTAGDDAHDQAGQG